MTRFKKLLAVLLILALTLSLSGCGMFEMKLAKAVLSMKKLDSLRADFSVDLDMSISIFGNAALSSDIDVDVNGTADLITGPLKGKIDLDITALDETTPLLVYLENAAGNLLLYFSPDEGRTWQKYDPQVSGTFKIDLGKEELSWLTQVASSFQETGTVTVKGSQATEYSGVIKWEDITSGADMEALAKEMSDALGTPVSSSDLNLGSAGDVPVTLCIDNKNGMITKFTMDLTSLMHSLMPFVMDLAMKVIAEKGGLGSFASFAGGLLQVSLDVDRFFVSTELYDFNAVADFTIPDEAQNAPLVSEIHVPG